MLPYTAWKYKHISKVGGQTWLYYEEITARYGTFRFMLIELSFLHGSSTGEVADILLPCSFSPSLYSMDQV